MTPNPHAPYVEQLARAGDWAALLRYWIAHQHQPALEAAAGCVRDRVLAGDVLFQPLLDYLEPARKQPLGPAPETIVARLGACDQLTLLLLNLCQQAFGCEVTVGIQAERRRMIVEAGVVAANRAVQIAVTVDDTALAALLWGLRERGHYELRQSEASMEAWQTAIKLYRKLCRHRPEIYLPYVVPILHNLGNLYVDQGDLKSARSSFHDALTVLRRLANSSPRAFQKRIAKTLNSLGNVHAGMNKLKLALASYREALSVLQNLAGGPWDVRGDIVATLNSLGTVLRDVGELDSSMASFDDALALCRELVQQSPQHFRADLAMTLNNLGNVQREVKRFERARASLSEALEIQSALALVQPEVFRPWVAITLNNLGTVLGELNELEAARAHLQRALKLRRELALAQPRVYRADLAVTLNNLGIVLRGLNDLEESRVRLEEASRIRRGLAEGQPEIYGADLATTLNNLGLVLRDLSELEASQVVFTEALTIQRKLALRRIEVFRQHEAMTLNNLGAVQRDLNELKLARNSFRKALGIRRSLTRLRPQVYAQSLATTLNNLGNVQRDLNQLIRARTSLCEALSIWRELSRTRPEDYRQHEAMTLNNLGAVQARLKDFHLACGIFDSALAIRRKLAQERPDVYRADVAQTLTNFGEAQRELSDLDGARISFEQAARLHTENSQKHATARLVERQGCWVKLGALLRQRSSRHGWPDYHSAREALLQGQMATEQFRGCFTNPAQRKRVQNDLEEVHDLLAETCLDLWDESTGAGQPDTDKLREAVEAAEAGRARQILDLLADEIFTPNLPPEEHELAATWRRIRRQFLQARRWLRQEEEREVGCSGKVLAREHGWFALPGESRRVVGSDEAVMPALSDVRSPNSAATKSVSAPAVRTSLSMAQEALARHQREHDEVLADIRRSDPQFSPDGHVMPTGLKELRERLPNDAPTGLVQLTVARDGGFALIVTHQDLMAVRLPELTEEWARKHAIAWSKRYDDLSRLAFSKEVCPQDMLSKWLMPLVERVVRPLVEGLESLCLKRLVLAPHRALHLFPLHACEMENGHHFGDAFEILYTPSLSMWHRCACRQRPAPKEMLLIQNPTIDSALRFTDLEGNGVLRRFQPNVTACRGMAAQKDVLLELGPRSHVWHYCGHARFDAKEPLQSALVLGSSEVAAFGEQWLTLRDVFTRLHLPQNSLSILNGCKTGMLRPEMADDYVNLSTGFLYAGARCVISTLWEVNDLSSALVMERFYALWRGDNGAKRLTPSAALREAVRWLREDIASGTQVAQDLMPKLLAKMVDADARAHCEIASEELAHLYPDRPPFASPMHWAPFVCSGAGHLLDSAHTELRPD